MRPHCLDTHSRPDSRSWMALLLSLPLTLLSGCGGGTDPLLDKLEPALKYVGTWSSGCEDSALTSSAEAGRKLKATYEYTFTRRESDKLRFKVVHKIYSAASDCGGNPLATHVNDSPDNTYSIDGKTTVDGWPADKLTVDMAALGGPFAADGPLERDGIRYPGDFFISSVDGHKDVAAFSLREIRFGTGEAQAGHYPGSLESRHSLRKSP